MKLVSFDVQGYRSLAEVTGFTLGRPAILTGENDGGKTATIGALRFLLRGTALDDDDRTFADWNDSNDGDGPGRVPATTVTGRFELSTSEASELGLPPGIELRRTSTFGSDTSLEIKMTVPQDERLRGLDDHKLPHLKNISAILGVESRGPKTHRESWLSPLRDLAHAAPTVDEWVPAPSNIGSHLPTLIEFASTAEPDPEHDATLILRSAFEAAVKNSDRVARLRDLEDEVTSEVAREAQALANHVLDRCPDLNKLVISPQISFKEGFRGVEILAAADSGEAMALMNAGAGRRRRITLAVWEWTAKLLDEKTFSSGVVVAYDEPDTHLDYRHQRDLMDLILAQCLLPHVQVLVATHSMNLIDRVDIASVQHLRLEEGHSALSRLVDPSHEGIEAYLSDIASAVGLRNSVLLHERCFVAVEGPTESQALPILFRSATGMTLQAAGIALVPCNGNRGAIQLAQFLQSRGRAVAFIVDKDSTANRDTRKLFNLETLKSLGFKDSQMHYVGDPLELEEVFTDEQWTIAANNNWKRTDAVPWVSSDVTSLREGGKFSQSIFELFKATSETGPNSKPEMVATLAATIQDPKEVPDQLRTLFTVLSEIAQG